MPLGLVLLGEVSGAATGRTSEKSTATPASAVWLCRRGSFTDRNALHMG